LRRYRLQGLESAYARGETDEFVLPTAVLDSEGQTVTLDPEDSVVFMNFRADRAREISQAITSTTFDSFDRNREPHQGYFCTLTEYHQEFDYPIAFPSVDIKNGLGEYLSVLGMKQLRLAETEKYAHVTFFLNGGIDTPSLEKTGYWSHRPSQNLRFTAGNECSRGHGSFGRCDYRRQI